MNVKKGCQWQPFDSVSGEVNGGALTSPLHYRRTATGNTSSLIRGVGCKAVAPFNTGKLQPPCRILFRMYDG